MVSSDVIQQIQREIALIEAEESVRVLYAVESGSRAWGFASADSDYDVRLIYIHRPEWYLSINLKEKRDVIERQCPGDIDLSGWDIRKAFRLFAKSNPPLLEWLDSPIVYREDHEFTSSLRELLNRFYSPAACIYHYLSMARNTEAAYLRGPTVKVKKYFYLLRPLLAARWIEQDRGPVPMLFSRLLDTISDRNDLLLKIDELLARKTAGTEMGEESRIGVIHEFATVELPRLDDVAAKMTKQSVGIEPLNVLFRKTLGTMGRVD
jgi:uncharacterized protein